MGGNSTGCIFGNAGIASKIFWRQFSIFSKSFANSRRMALISSTVTGAISRTNFLFAVASRRPAIPSVFLIRIGSWMALFLFSDGPFESAASLFIWSINFCSIPRIRISAINALNRPSNVNIWAVKHAPITGCTSASAQIPSLI